MNNTENTNSIQTGFRTSSPGFNGSAGFVAQDEYNEMWDVVCKLLGQTVSSFQVQTWIQPLRIKTIEKVENRYKVFLEASCTFTANWVRDHHKKTIEEVFSKVAGQQCDVYFDAAPDGVQTLEPLTVNEDHYSVSEAEKPQGDFLNFKGPGATGLSSEGLVSGTVLAAQSRAPRLRSDDNRPDPRYTFESFVVGASNQFAFASAIAVAEQPAKAYNPLFLFGPPGLGKTHLLHAIGNFVQSRVKGSRVAYLAAEKFVNELIESLQHRKMSDFRAKYRDGYDVILIDDIQFLAGKNTSEEEFFHTFNALHSTGRQIIVSSDRPPKEIQGLAERIRTRFEWGLVADIKPPEIETRIAILKTKADRDDIYLPEDVATFLASHVKSNVRELEGVLIRLQAQASLTGAEISLEMAKTELHGAVPEEDSHVTVESIQNAVTKYFQIRLPDLKSTSRAKSVSLPRQIAMFLIRKYTGMGFQEIGQYFGGKDHSTIVHACQKIEKSIDAEEESEIKTAVEGIQNLL